MSLVRFRPKAPFAGLAHLVERHLAKVEVASSSLVTRSNTPHYAGLQFGSIAQLVEHLPYKQGVTGSSPVVSTIETTEHAVSWFFVLSVSAFTLLQAYGITGFAA